MRRAIVLSTLCAALGCALPAAGALVPVQRTYGEHTLPRLRAGTIEIPSGHASARVRVIARLELPPLAAEESARALASGATPRRLNVHSSSSRVYLARVRAAQDRFAASLRRAIPQARVGRRFSILVDGVTVSLPVRALPKLVAQPAVTRIYTSVRYTLELNRSPSIIGADVLRRLAGADGSGVKIGVVDDGVDEANKFFDPSGFSYPVGFPRGGLRWTTPKVIVARAFPGPGSGRAGRLPLDPRASFHGTHVAGIAAGDEGTTAPPGEDHPETPGLSGVAPRAWIGNYRVFNVPTPIGHVADTPEIVAAFESAVSDGMDVINFSGGGSQTDPANDAMIETIRNVSRAGVVPVIAAGNDREEFGLGSIGSPGVAPDAIAVAAVTNTHVFAPALTATAANAPASLQEIPFRGAAGERAPIAWSSQQILTDVGSIVGKNGLPVDPHLCGPPGDLASPESQLPAHSLEGEIALAQRGLCPFVTKAEQARLAGAVGIILADNRAGEPNTIPIRLQIPAGMISNLDAERLRAFMAATAGRTTIRVGQDIREIATGRGGIVASFSSAGPTAFGHELKPDVAAPGSSILSSTTPSFARGAFAVFDGTSMATPHVAGAAALLVQLHRSWSPPQIKSALMSTAGPAWGDTARTQEAPVTLEGAGLVSLPAATDPKLFTDPSSLSFEELNVSRGAETRGRLVRITDAGDGAGTWQVELRPQSASQGAAVELPGTVVVPPGGEAELPVVARGAADGATGENYGFVVLRRGDVVRRIPYDFEITRPGLELQRPSQLKRIVAGDTRLGANRVDRYAFPASPFGNPPDQPPMEEDGAEHVYVMRVTRPAANAGVSVVVQSGGARIDPWFLGSLDENDVQGQVGTPIDVNEFTFDYLLPIGAAGAAFPRQKDYFVSVDSGREVFSDQRLAGQYLLRSWLNDVRPPSVKLLTTRVAAGRPTLVLRTTDTQSGVDPLSLTIAYNRVLVGAAAYDPFSGIAVFPLPARAPALARGTVRAVVAASDYQEAKNTETPGTNLMPNTRFRAVKLHVVSGPAVTWLNPSPNACVARSERLVVVASSTAKLRSVSFRDRGRSIAVDRSGPGGLYAVTWQTRGARAGAHVLAATLTDARGRTVTARRDVRVCR